MVYTRVRTASGERKTPDLIARHDRRAARDSASGRIDANRRAHHLEECSGRNGESFERKFLERVRDLAVSRSDSAVALCEAVLTSAARGSTPLILYRSADQNAALVL